MATAGNADEETARRGLRVEQCGLAELPAFAEHALPWLDACQALENLQSSVVHALCRDPQSSYYNHADQPPVFLRVVRCDERGEEQTTVLIASMTLRADMLLGTVRQQEGDSFRPMADDGEEGRELRAVLYALADHVAGAGLVVEKVSGSYDQALLFLDRLKEEQQRHQRVQRWSGVDPVALPSYWLCADMFQTEHLPDEEEVKAHFRAGTLDDVARLAGYFRMFLLDSECVPQVNSDVTVYEQPIRALLERRSVFLWVDGASDAICGMVSVRETDGYGRVAHVVVDRAMRGKGIGTKLVGTACACALGVRPLPDPSLEDTTLNRGMQQLFLMALGTNPASNKLYTNLGYKQVNVRAHASLVPRYTVRQYGIEQIDEYAARVLPYLARSIELHNLNASVVRAIAKDPTSPFYIYEDQPPIFLAVLDSLREDDDAVVGVALMNMKARLLCATVHEVDEATGAVRVMDAGPARPIMEALADHIAEKGDIPLESITAAVPQAHAFCNRIVARKPESVARWTVDVEMHAYALPRSELCTEHVPSDEDIAAHFRIGTAQDAERIGPWVRRFLVDCGMGSEAKDMPVHVKQAESLLSKGSLFFWVNADREQGAPTTATQDVFALLPEDSIAGMISIRVTENFSRVAHVITDSALRGRGISTKLCATSCAFSLGVRDLPTGSPALSASMLSTPVEHMFLYALIGNPASNRVYQKLGFRQVDQSATLDFISHSAALESTGDAESKV